ncbi:MAG: Eco57I restriction-modification methylase domain-containing protein [Chitinophagales bacterium]|nr:Eco57I restriction-modification methylase domain-containing protein [Chitinophagales bacterium]
MAISKQEFSDYIKQFRFREMFNEMGWDNDTTTTPIVVDAISYELKAVARKSGFKILLCNTTDKNIPDYSTRKKIETKVTKSFQEHLLIFTDAKKQEQIWQLVVRHTGKPSKITETRYHISQDPELLYQRAAGIFFELDEEEHINIIDVTKRVTENFHQNNERVTKQFYDKFKQQHTSFLKFIKGIDEKVNQEWYASLMLNRLMFCYFIQKKGFLDNNKNYLSDKLKECQKKKGKDKFYSFYRNFLLHLFHDGLGAPDHSKKLTDEIGKIPYLNGGLFDEHELEKNHSKIEIDDKAFEKIFEFFDQYEWHLDTRHTASGKDINPDVIGYIFEKYINDRADMGAYYTKEDITDYISKNCILPFLFDETKRQQPKAFNADAEIWKAVKESSDKYIYDAVKKGAEEKLPKEIADGIKNISARTEWNKPAPENFSLPTEIWREVVDRRNRYTEIKNKIEKSEVTAINDFITYNLNIRQFAIDSIANTNDPEFLKAFYKALNSVTIIDPTCGSGAFLFAAMNILEELYEQCIQRMQNFVSDAPKGKYKFFEETIAQVTAHEHPNLQYFIYKNIILRNLYGVDIMKEAVEIAKLRLFLKLVATVEANYRKPNLGLEPLPDIDFNIRSGNTLVGFATEAELTKGLAYTLDGVLAQPVIEEKCDVVAKAFSRYKEIQLSYGDDYKAFKKAKDDLQRRLKELNHELNLLLHKQAEGLKFEKWLESYQPFHWFAEFYEIVSGNKGFNIIIGNPPYVVYTAASYQYKVKGYDTLTCANLYAFCCERSFKIMNTTGRFGMIIPNSSISADKLEPLQKIITKEKNTWISNYAWRPAKLFEGANMLLAIVLSSKSEKKNVMTTIYHKWYNDYRDSLFENLTYRNATEIIQSGTIPKIPSEIFYTINTKLKKESGKSTIKNYFLNQPNSHKFFYFRAVLYWVKILEKAPIFREDGKQTTTGEMKPVYVESDDLKYILVSLLSSTAYFIHYITWSSCQVINSRDFEFPFNLEKLNDASRKKLAKFGKELQKDLQENSTVNLRNYSAKGRTFKMEKQYFYIKKSKSIIDKIDEVLAEHYGFTDEELDFIINYDIKYRMGKESENGEEE